MAVISTAFLYLSTTFTRLIAGKFASITAAVTSLVGSCPYPLSLFEITSLTFIRARVEFQGGEGYAGVCHQSRHESHDGNEDHRS